MALSSPLLLLTIISNAGEWMYLEGLLEADDVAKQHRTALQALQNAVGLAHQPRSCTADPSGMSAKVLDVGLDTLGAVLMQVTNSYFLGWGPVQYHLDAASHLIQELGISSVKGGNFMSSFLLQRFILLDVWSAMLQNHRPLLPSGHWALQPDAMLDARDPSFREMTGCPHPVICILSRICHLVADLGKEDTSDTLRDAFIAENDLRLYGSTTGIHEKVQEQDAQSDYEILARCWYWCAHLLIQRRIYADPWSSRRVSETVYTLTALVESISSSSKLYQKIETFLCVLAVEAEDEVVVQWILKKNKALAKRTPSKTRDDIVDAMTARVREKPD
jgi:hypothetical protein